MMSLLTVCGWSALRAVAIVCFATPVCLWLVRFLRDAETRFFEKTGFLAVRCLVWGLLLVPFLTPELLVGYAYGNFSPFPLVRHPWMCELLYAVLLWLKLVPVGVVVLYFSPPSPISAEAMHCRRMLFARSTRRMGAGDEAESANDDSRNVRSLGAAICRPPSPFRILLTDRLRGPARRLVPALGLVFLLAFQDFELGALLGITAGRVGSPVMWTRTLFESQAGVIDRLAPLKWSLWPLLFDFLLLATIVRVAVGNAHLAGSSLRQSRSVRRRTRLAVWLYLSIVFIIVAILPLAFVLREALSAFAAIVVSREQFVGLLREIVVGCTFAGVAGLLAYLLAAVPLSLWSRNQTESRRLRSILACLPLVPGLAGSLVVALSILYLFQTEWLNGLYDSPLPLAIALVLFLAPRALLLQLLFRAAQQREPLRLAELLSDSGDDHRRRNAGRLVWSLSRSRHFWATALLALWAYWDLTSTTLLHPSQMVPASVRLYNLMHYGHNAVLSTMTILAVSLPVCFAFVLAVVIRPLSGRFV